MHTPLEAAVAVSLYSYNVSPMIRAMRLHGHFEGNCAEIEDLVDILSGPRLAFWATELAAPTAEVYLEHALKVYGQEARARLDLPFNPAPRKSSAPRGPHAGR